MKLKLIFILFLAVGFTRADGPTFEQYLSGAWAFRGDIGTMSTEEVQSSFLEPLYNGIGFIVASKPSLTPTAEGVARSNASLISMFSNAVFLSDQLSQSTNPKVTAAQKTLAIAYNDFFNLYRAKGTFPSPLPAAPPGMQTITGGSELLTKANQLSSRLATDGLVSSTTEIAKFFTDFDAVLALYNQERTTKDMLIEKKLLLGILDKAKTHKDFWRPDSKRQIANRFPQVKDPLPLLKKVELLTNKVNEMLLRPADVTMADVDWVVTTLNGTEGVAMSGLVSQWYRARALELAEVANPSPLIACLDRLISNKVDFSDEQLADFARTKTEKISATIPVETKCREIMAYLTEFETKYLVTGLAQEVFDLLAPAEVLAFVRGVELLLGTACWTQIRSTEPADAKTVETMTGQVATLNGILVSAKTSSKVFSLDQQSKITDYLTRLKTGITTSVGPTPPIISITTTTPATTTTTGTSSTTSNASTPSSNTTNTTGSAVPTNTNVPRGSIVAVATQPTNPGGLSRIVRKR